MACLLNVYMCVCVCGGGGVGTCIGRVCGGGRGRAPLAVLLTYIYFGFSFNQRICTVPMWF